VAATAVFDAVDLSRTSSSARSSTASATIRHGRPALPDRQT
jgi:hypothetical protein